MQEGYIMRVTASQNTPMKDIKAQYCAHHEVAHPIFQIK